MKKNKSFTLLEILIALAILVIGVAAVINLFPIGLHAGKRAADFSMAGILAQEKMAELMYLGEGDWDEIDSDLTGTGTHSGLTPPSTNQFASPDDQYRWHLYLDGTAMDGLAMASLRIYWNDRGVERHATFITYIADHEA